MLYELLIYAPILGLLAGFLSGLLGIGGGVIIVPALMFLLPILPDVNSTNVALVAIATSLATIIVTTFSSAKSHYKRGNVDFKFVTPIAMAVAITAFIAPYLASLIGGHWLKIVFACLLLAVALQMILSKTVAYTDEKEASSEELFLGGALTGLLAGIAGLGGGAILVPYLTFIKVNIRKAIGAAAASGMIVAIFGSIGYLLNGLAFSQSPEFLGYVHWPTALAIMVFSYMSAPLGVKVSGKLEQKQLKRVFAVFLILVSIKLLTEQF